MINVQTTLQSVTEFLHIFHNIYRPPLYFVDTTGVFLFEFLWVLLDIFNLIWANIPYFEKENSLQSLHD